MSGFRPDLLAGQRYAVLGLGRNGNAVVRALLAMGAEVTAWDDRARDLPEHPALNIAPIEDLTGYTALVLSPGIPHLLPKPHPVADLARSAGVPILSDAELLFTSVRASGSRARFAAITGTNGKSTTTALLAHILSACGLPNAAGGNLGNAALSLPLLPDEGVYAIEMSSYMLERLDRFHADCAVLLNFSADHLDRHGDMAGYAAAKAHVFDHMGANDLALLGTPDAYMRSIEADLRAKGATPLWLPTPQNGTLEGQGWSFDLASAPALPGAHNAQNIASAFLMARHLGLEDTQIAQAIRTFPGLAHRQALAGCVQGVAFINDSKATNADAAERALICYEKLIWIAGGVAKSGGITPLSPHFGRVAHALLIGEAAKEFAAVLAQHHVPHSIVGTLEAAVSHSLSLALRLQAPIVLLSPACASFDQFTSFEARGERFCQSVNNLLETESSPQTQAKAAPCP